MYNHTDQKRTLSYLLLKKRLSASEMADIRPYMPFLLYGLPGVSMHFVHTWHLIAAYAAEYKRRSFSPENLAHWAAIRTKLLCALPRTFFAVKQR